MNRKLKFVAILVGVLLGVVSAYTYIATNIRIHSIGSVQTLNAGAYWDSNCTQRVVQIDWGYVEKGSINNITVYLRNEGELAATFTMHTQNWNPASASNYISLSWDYTGETVPPNNVIPVKFSLSVSENTTGITEFSFDIIIIASG